MTRSLPTSQDLWKHTLLDKQGDVALVRETDSQTHPFDYDPNFFSVRSAKASPQGGEG